MVHTASVRKGSLAPSSPLIAMKDHPRITINVSGLLFEIRIKTLEAYPQTLLGDPDRRSRYFDSARNELFFERDRLSFDAILSYYRNGGEIRRPPNVTLESFLQEIKFFDLGEKALHKFFKLEHLFGQRRRQPTNPLQRKLWHVVENPGSSIGATLFGQINIMFVLLSVTSLCVQSLPELRRTLDVTVDDVIVKARADEVGLTNDKEDQPFFAIETTCMVWFCLDLVLRFLVSPEKARFFIRFRNLFDIISLSPYFINIFLFMALEEGLVSLDHVLIAFRAIRIVRVCRILKITSHLKGMQVFMYTIKAAFGELALLMLLISVWAVVFSTGIFYAESHQPGTNFTSIPSSFYWAIITMTTTGYGDVYPQGPWGQVVSSVCAVVGVIVFSLGIPAVARKFDDIYQRLRDEEKIRQILRKSFQDIDADCMDEEIEVVPTHGCLQYRSASDNEGGCGSSALPNRKHTLLERIHRRLNPFQSAKHKGSASVDYYNRSQL
ncbi:Potassium voltage-gated channel protein Shaker [Hypsibius exemplaris]|uniref:Potassium voltage-gated channel protein Shaker n=1 Tax=Hypsibius exemplaris TaxID=2072580 RepID=A0A1W0X225_HYPEX|nr:Potassium voltage-gated channel protein Shaker [Hypsibius exemplaris]